jgi:hypothetical protein
VGTRVSSGTGGSTTTNFTNTDKVMAFDVIGDGFICERQRDPRRTDATQPAMLVKESDSIRTHDAVRP